MASLPTRTTASFAAIAPVPNLTVLDNEFNQYVGASGIFNGGTTGTKLLVKTSDATDPPVDCDQVGAGPLARFKLSGTAKVTIGNDGRITCANTAVNPGLNADQVDGIEGANIAKLDTHKTMFSVTWFYSTLPGAVESTESVGRFLVPNGVSMNIHLITAVWAGGSASGANNIFTLKRRNNSGTLQADIGTINLTGGAQNAHFSAAANTNLSFADQVYPLFTTRNTGSETLVSISVHGTQKFTT